jgi:CheY-like chemotaxis protein
MINIGSSVLVDPVQGVSPFGNRTIPIPHSVLIVRDDDKNSDFLDSICEFLDVAVEHASSRDDLTPLLQGLRPIAVITDLDSDVQDGFHVMKITANYKRTLPIMLLTGNDPALLGAVEAVQEVWDLKRVATITGTEGIGTMVDFICHAARDAGMPQLMRV